MVAKPRPGPFRVFFGDEAYLLDEILVKAKSQQDRDVTVFDGKDKGTTGKDIVSLCEMPNFAGQDKGVVVDNAHKLKKPEPLLDFIKGWDVNDDSVVLLIIARASKIGSWIKAAADLGVVREFQQPKPWKLEERVARIKRQADKVGVRLDDDVPELLIKILGYDLRIIVNELNKLHYLVDGETANRDHVRQLVPFLFPVEPYQVAEAALSKKPDKAMTLLSFVYRNLGASAHVPVTYALLRLFERVLLVRDMSDRGDSTKVIAERLGMHEFALKKNLLPMARLHQVSELRAKMQTVCRLDTLVKGPARSKRTQVELVLFSIAS
jgi:DNA polymerase III delta subunit